MLTVAVSLCALAAVQAAIPGGLPGGGDIPDIPNNPGGNLGGGVDGGVTGGVDLGGIDLSGLGGVDLGGLQKMLMDLKAAGYPIDDSAFAGIMQAQLDIDNAEVQTNAAIVASNSAFADANGALQLANAAVIDANLVTESALKLAAKLTVNAEKDLKTANLLVLQAGGELDVQGDVSSLGLVLEDSNKVMIGADGSLKTAVVTVGKDANSEIRGSFSVINKHIVDILENAKLTIGAAGEAGAAALVEAKIALKDAKAQLIVANDAVLSAKSSVDGAGELVVKAHLDAQQVAANALSVGKLSLESASKLSVKASADAQTAIKVAGEAALAGELAVDAAADVKTIVLEHASRTGKFEKVTVSGSAAVDVAARKRDVLESEWEVKYEDSKTTISKKTSGTDGSNAMAITTSLVAAALAIAAFL